VNAAPATYDFAYCFFWEVFFVCYHVFGFRIGSCHFRFDLVKCFEAGLVNESDLSN
jgi:hypothetical protein